MKKIKKRKKFNNIFASGLEAEFAELLDKYNIKYEPQFKLYYSKEKFKTYDFYLLNTNLLIEIHGDFFHSNPLKFKKKINNTQRHIRENDSFKKRLAYEQNYIVIEVWQTDIIQNKEYVETLIQEFCNLYIN